MSPRRRFSIVNFHRTFHMTGCTVADTDNIFAFWFKSEVCIECSHSVNPGGIDIRCVCDKCHHFAGKIPVLFLYLLKNGYKVFRIAIVFLQNRTDCFKPAGITAFFCKALRTCSFFPLSFNLLLSFFIRIASDETRFSCCTTIFWGTLSGTGKIPDSHNPRFYHQVCY